MAPGWFWCGFFFVVCLFAFVCLGFLFSFGVFFLVGLVLFLFVGGFLRFFFPPQFNIRLFSVLLLLRGCGHLG